jgi:hypothetical protein
MMPLCNNYCGRNDCRVNNWKAAAAASRKFVRMEQREKAKSKLSAYRNTPENKEE